MKRGIGVWCCVMIVALSTFSVSAETGSNKAKRQGVANSKVQGVNGQRIMQPLRRSSNDHIQSVDYRSNQNNAVQQDFGGSLRLESSKALIVNQNSGEVLYAKGDTDIATPIASVTKLMTAMVLLDAHLPMDEKIVISESDVDTLKGSGSRLRVGSVLTRSELLQLALMASENRAASALARSSFPNGLTGFVAAMNQKAVQLGMTKSFFADGTGLSSENISTTEDLVKMVIAAYQYPEIRQVTTTVSYDVPVRGYRHPQEFRNTNLLVRNKKWEIGLSKTGYISESGRCLVMQAQLAGQPLVIVLLDSWGKYSRIGDAQRIKKWIESSNGNGRRSFG